MKRLVGLVCSVCILLLNMMPLQAGAAEVAGGADEKGPWIYYTLNPRESDEHLYKILSDGTMNTQLNSDRTGEIRIIDDWIYYEKREGDREALSSVSYLYRVHTDGTQRMKVSDDQIGRFFIIGDWIYYENDSAKLSIYKIRTDGTSRTRITQELSQIIGISGDWLYYISAAKLSGPYMVYKIRTDGTKRTQILKGNLANSVTETLSGDWIYYWSVDGSLNRVSTDGKKKNCLAKDVMMQAPCIMGDMIYYTDIRLSNYRMSLDGKQKTRFGASIPGAFMGPFLGGCFYSISPSSKLFKVPVDGTSAKMLCDANTQSQLVYAANGFIYFTDITGGVFTIYKIKPDGTDKTEISQARGLIRAVVND